MKSVLLRWAPSLNDCSKLKGQYTDVKSCSGISVGPSLKPHSLSKKKNSRDTVPLTPFQIEQNRDFVKLPVLNTVYVCEMASFNHCLCTVC